MAGPLTSPRGRLDEGLIRVGDVERERALSALREHYALGRIDAVASDFEMKTGFCGKGGQRVPVGTGQGHVRIGELTVGGTAV